MVGFSSTSFPNYAVSQKNSTTATYDDKFYSDEEYSHSDSYDSEYDSEDSAEYEKSKPAPKSAPSTSSNAKSKSSKKQSFYSDESDYSDDNYSEDSETDSFAPPYVFQIIFDYNHKTSHAPHRHHHH
jgi:hypothetical protein